MGQTHLQVCKASVRFLNYLPSLWFLSVKKSNWNLIYARLSTVKFYFRILTEFIEVCSNVSSNDEPLPNSQKIMKGKQKSIFVYRCMHVHFLSNDKAQFSSFYKNINFVRSERVYHSVRVFSGPSTDSSYLLRMTFCCVINFSFLLVLLSS